LIFIALLTWILSCCLKDIGKSPTAQKLGRITKGGIELLDKKIQKELADTTQDK
jgi:hypothetical protein